MKSHPLFSFINSSQRGRILHIAKVQNLQFITLITLIFNNISHLTGMKVSRKNYQDPQAPTNIDTSVLFVLHTLDHSCHITVDLLF